MSREKNSTRFLILARIFLALVVAAILALSLWPKPPELPGLRMSDKIAHFIAYIILGGSALAAAARKGIPELLIVAAVCSLFGGLIEIVQPLVGRSREIVDFLVDVAGSALGAGLVLAVRAVARRRS